MPKGKVITADTGTLAAHIRILARRAVTSSNPLAYGLCLLAEASKKFEEITGDTCIAGAGEVFDAYILNGDFDKFVEGMRISTQEVETDLGEEWEMTYALKDF